MPARKTLAMVQTAPGELVARDLPIPEIGHDDALLRIEACGICGSDYEQFEGVLKTPVPVIPGHEEGRIVVVINLEEGIRMVSNLCEIAYEDVTRDMPVEVFFEEAQDGFKIPLFRPLA